MKPLKNVIEALRKDLAAAIVNNRGAKVSVTLQVVIQPTAGAPADEVSVQVLTTEDAQHIGTHSVHIEFDPAVLTGAIAPTGNESRSIETNVSPAQELNPAATQHLRAEFSALFGEPGFDSSARATVFREVIEEVIRQNRQREFVAAFSNPATWKQRIPGLDPFRERLVRVLRSGPVKDETRATEKLSAIVRGFALDLLPPFIHKHWREQTDWIT